MPLTYFAHQVFVVPFKWLRPRWFDGTALCIGSMAPDFAYAFTGTPLDFGSHTLAAQLTWTLPVTYLLTRLVRGFLAEPLGAQLPDPWGAEVRALACSAHRWPITVVSALLGGCSHVFVDGFTHRYGWGYDHVAWLHQPIADGWQVADAMQYVGHTLGTLLGALLFYRLCVTRRVSHWNGSCERQRELPLVVPWFWSAFGWGASACALVGVLAILSGVSLPVAIIRTSYVALCVLCLIVFSMRRERQVAL